MNEFKQKTTQCHYISHVCIIIIIITENRIMVVQAKNVEIGLVDFSLKGVYFKYSSIQYSNNIDIHFYCKFWTAQCRICNTLAILIQSVKCSTRLSQQVLGSNDS